MGTLRHSGPLLALLLAATTAQAQPAPPTTAVRPPAALQPEPGDIWADVRAWTARRNAQLPPTTIRPTGTTASAVGRARLAEGDTATIRPGARANLRGGPDTAAPVLRMLPAGMALKIFALGPEPWYQVGEQAPAGWVHGSVLQRRGP